MYHTSEHSNWAAIVLVCSETHSCMFPLTALNVKCNATTRRNPEEKRIFKQRGHVFQVRGKRLLSSWLLCVTLKARLSAAFGAVPPPRQFKRPWNAWLEHISLSPPGRLSSSLWKQGCQGAVIYGVITAASLKTEHVKMVAGERERDTQIGRGEKKRKMKYGHNIFDTVLLLDFSWHNTHFCG